MTRRFPAYLILILFLGSPAWALGPGSAPISTPAATPSPTPEPEAPEAIFDQDVGDMGVKLDAQGTWTTNLSGGWGGGFTPQGFLSGEGYPGYTSGILFNQLPNFSLDLTLNDRYYFQVTFGGDLDDRTYQVGYNGQPGEFVEWFKAGNTPFTVVPRAGQTFPEGRPGDLAAGAGFTTGPVSFEGAAEYQDGIREVRRFLGYRDLGATTVTPDAWIKNRFFQLPGTGPWNTVQVLIADPNGTTGITQNGITSTFRQATTAEVSINLLSGEIDLPDTAGKEYLVTWSGASAYTAYQSPLLKIPVTQVNGTGPTPWFVLAQPGVMSPFELRNRYPVPLGTTGAILFYNDDQNVPDGSFTVGYSPNQNWFVVSGAPEAPFGSRFPGIYPQSSAGTPPPATATLGESFHLPVSVTATSFNLGSSVIPSTIVVTRNGVATTDFQFDPTSGTLNFNIPVFDSDSIVISFENANTGNTASNLAVWQGGRWDIDDLQNLEWALQSQWNVSQSSSTTQDLESPGQATGTLAWAGTSGPWGWNVQATGGARLSDSTGTRMVYGQSDSGFQATLDGNALRPAAAPGFFQGLNLTESNRAPAYFRNFWTADPTSGAPVVRPWGVQGVGRSPWQAGGWVGPYYVQGDGQRTDTLAVLESDLPPGSWTGMSVFLNKGLTQDISATSAITVTLRDLESLEGSSVLPGAPVRIFLVAGNISRNFDGTGALRSVTYLSYPAIAFTNQAQGWTQDFPIPEDSSWGNDPGNSGSSGQDGTLVVHELTSGSDSQLSAPLDPTSTAWQTVTVNLTAAERQRLRNATGWRLVAVAPATWTTTQTRTILVGPTVFEGSTWSVVADNSSTGSVNPTEYTDPNRNNGHYLQIAWTSDRQSWTIQGRNPAMDPRAYRTLTFQYQSTVAAPVTLNLTDINGRGVHATWNAGVAGTRQTVKVPINGGTVTSNGSAVGKASNDAQTAEWDRMTVSMTNTGGVAGSLYLTEIEATDAAWQAIGTTKADLTWTQEAPWPSSDIPVVSSMKVDLTSTQAGLDQYTFSWSNQARVSGNLWLLQTNAETLVTQTPGEETFHGAYKATLPLGTADGPSLVVSDQFSDQGLRAEEATVGIPWVGTLHGLAKADGPPTTLAQSYQAGWASPVVWPEGWAGALSANWDQTYNMPVSLGNFGETWTDSWSWLQPEDSVAPYYQLQGQAGFHISPAPVGFGIDTQAKVTQAEATQTVWTPDGSWTMKVPFRLDGPTSLLITPSATREVTAIYNLESPVATADSVPKTLDELGTRGLAEAPFEEWFQPGSPWDSASPDLVSGTVMSSVGVGWERTAAEDWTDLLIPYSGTIVYMTNSGWASGSSFTNETIQTTLMARGINLFGILGSQPIFLWYRTDSLTWSFTGSWEDGSRVQDQNISVGVASDADLVLTQNESLGLPVNYSGTWGGTSAETLGIKPSWTIKYPANLPFELPGWVSPRQFKRMFVQNFSLAMNMGWPETPNLRDLEFNWKGRFLLSEKSELDLSTKWGQQWQNNLVRVGMETDLDLILSF